MQSQLIEAGQRLNMRTDEKSVLVVAQVEAIVPAGYWICKDEASGQRRVIAATALSPLEAPPITIEPNQPPALIAPTALAPLGAPPITIEPNQPPAFVASTAVSTSDDPPDGRVAA